MIDRTKLIFKHERESWYIICINRENKIEPKIHFTGLFVF